MKIATLNINSINARLPNLLKWLQQNNPDVMLLQEIKTEFDGFPLFDLQMAGYNCEILGQKSYNGVAVLSRHPMQISCKNLPCFSDENARYLEVMLTKNHQKYSVASLYLPNGNPPYNNPTDTSRFTYKLQWMDNFLHHAENMLLWHKNIVLAGDFNVMLTDNDVYNPDLFKGGALYCKEVINRLKQLTAMGYTDCFRTLYPSKTGYTFWDYTQNSFINDLGLRIDYVFCSPCMADKLQSCNIDRDFRSWEKSSDHTILITEFED